ncbi:MAG: dynamin family protein [Verrucomicrobiae bacterium]|nr:dynamin family protein [Verrucomicrobiae bacterium]
MSNLAQRAAELHERILQPLAERLAFENNRGLAASPGTPVVLFLGNHSSGKSSFINYLLGQQVQATGLAPTDDGFTVLTWGLQSATSDGLTVTTHPHLGFDDLAHLGPAFTSKLRLKTVPHDLLNTVTLVDSPGMIDAIGAANTRGYDFPAAVRVFAERADLILFFFDPDKPGTTAESIFVLTQTLAGLGYKLILVLNKVDRFASFRDFARTYGTLCWNLAKAITTKDIPHIGTCYLPSGTVAPDPHAGSIPLDDFDASRDEILSEIQRTPGRRIDNLITELLQRSSELLLHTRICREVGREYRRLRLQWFGALILTTALAAVAAWFAWPNATLSTRGWVVGIGVAAIGAAWWLGRWQARNFTRRRLHQTLLDEAFAQACETELALRDRADLRALWAGIRDRTARAIALMGPGRLALAFDLGRQIARLEKLVTREIPALRRDPGSRQPELVLGSNHAPATAPAAPAAPSTTPDPAGQPAPASTPESVSRT